MWIIQPNQVFHFSQTYTGADFWQNFDAGTILQLVAAIPGYIITPIQFYLIKSATTDNVDDTDASLEIRLYDGVSIGTYRAFMAIDVTSNTNFATLIGSGTASSITIPLTPLDDSQNPVLDENLALVLVTTASQVGITTPDGTYTIIGSYMIYKAP